MFPWLKCLSFKFSCNSFRLGYQDTMAKTLYIPDEEEYMTAHTPLLRSFPRDPEDGPDVPTSRTQRSSYYVLGLVLTIVFAADLAGSISKAPLIRVYESIICSAHYKSADPSLIENGQVEERYCKVAPVQEELALLRGWHDFFDYLPGMLLTTANIVTPLRDTSPTVHMY